MTVMAGSISRFDPEYNIHLYRKILSKRSNIQGQPETQGSSVSAKIIHHDIFYFGTKLYSSIIHTSKYILVSEVQQN